MTWILFALALLLAAIAAAFLKRLHEVELREWPLRRAAVLSKSEQVLYWRLVEALPEWVVLAQVQVSRMMKIEPTRRRQAVLNRIDRKSADFLVCFPNLQPLCVIELDDVSHTSARRRKADADKDAALAAAGIGVWRIRVKAMPDVEAIRTEIAAQVQRGGTGAHVEVGAGTSWPTARRRAVL